MKKVVVIGLGHVGLPLALIAAKAGLHVVGVDCNKERVDDINNGVKFLEEPDLAQYLQEALATSYFTATTVCQEADYFVIAVSTLLTADKRADLRAISSAVSQIAEVLKKGDTVILESTVPLGTTRSVAQVLAKESGLEVGKDFFVAHCPESVLSGNIFQELKVNDRIIGAIDHNSVQHAAQFYKYFVSGDLYLTDVTTAEMVKLIENSYRDVNIAFAHQIAAMAESEGLNPYEVIELANKHPRVSLLNPTCGVGGHCVPVDPLLLAESFPAHSELLKTSRRVNEERTHWVLDRIEHAITTWNAVHSTQPTVAVWGLTYKPNVDDLRESPALKIAEQLAKRTNSRLIVCDPHVKQSLLSPEISQVFCAQQDALAQADIVVYLVAHNVFKQHARKQQSDAYVLDFCGLLHDSRRESVEQEQFYWPACQSEKHYPMDVVHGITDRSFLTGERQ